MIFWICFWLIFIPLSLIYPTKVVNKKYFKKIKKENKNVIICCNHTSNLDAVIIDLRFKKKFHYLCKKELFKSKFTGFFMKKFGGIPVDRSKADLGAIKKTLKVLNEGKDLGIFPQGTREEIKDIDVETVKNGVTMFSLRTGVPVVPMALIKKPKAFKRNLIVVGEIIVPNMEKSKDKEYAEEFTNIVVSSINELRHKGEEMLCKKK